MARLFAALLALVVSSAVVAADPCTDLGESLGCSAWYAEHEESFGADHWPIVSF